MAFQGIERLLKGKPDEINPDIPLEEQKDLLPYDKTKWEIRRENLKFGEFFIIKNIAFNRIDDL